MESASSSNTGASQESAIMVGQWTTLSSRIPVGPRCNCGYALVGDEFVLIGGHDGSDWTDSVISMNIYTYQWMTSHTPLPEHLQGCKCVAAAIPNQREVVVISWNQKAATYNLVTKQWTVLPDMTHRSHDACLVVSGSIVYALGCEGLETLDLSQSDRHWAQMNTGVSPNTSFASAVVVGDKIVVVGRSNRTSHNLTCEVLDPRNYERGWKTVQPNMPFGHRSACAVTVHEKLVVLGGYNCGMQSIFHAVYNNWYRSASSPVDTVESYDFQSESWTKETPMSTKRSSFAAIATQDQIVVAGGVTSGRHAKYLDSVEVINIAKIDPTPPNLDPIPSGILDCQHTRQLELWIQKTQSSLAAYQSAVFSSKEQIRADYDHRKHAVQEYIAGLREKIRCLKDDLKTTEASSKQRISGINQTAEAWFDSTESQFDRANHLIQLARSTDEAEGTSSGSAPSPPTELLCPITLELMVDPVVAADGHTYERVAVEKWIRMKGRSPMDSGKSLAGKPLYPNHRARGEILSYMESIDSSSR